MSVDPIIVDHLVRHRALAAEAKAHARWFGQRRQQLDRQATVLEKAIAKMDSEARAELAKILAKVPDVNAFVTMQKALELARPTEGLGHEDRAYLAEVRSHLYDAYSCAAVGDFDGASQWAHQAHDRLNWMVTKRVRNRSTRILTAERAQALTDLLPMISAIATAVGRVQRG